MAKSALAGMFGTEQERQFAGLLDDVLDKIDDRFTAMDDKFQKRIKDGAADIARMHDRELSSWRQRFMAIAGHYQAGGEYNGPFASAEQAQSFGQLVAAVAKGPDAVRALANDTETAGISAVSGKAGGFLVPEALLPGITSNVEKYGVVERNVRTWPAEGESVSRVTRNQGATVYYPDFGVAPTESDLQVGRVRTTLTRYSTLAYLDRWMLGSNALAVALGDYVAFELGHALALATDRNAMIGDGSATYARMTGLFNLTSNIVTADSGDDTFAEVIGENVKYPTQVAGELPDAADDEHCKWYMHRSIFWGFVGTRDANDRPVADILTSEGKPQRILCGYPVEVTQVAPKLSESAVSTVMGVLANLQRGMELYRFGKGAELRVSEHVRFVEGEVAMLLDVLQNMAHVDEDMSVRLKTAAS